MRFTFTGTPVINGLETKNPYKREGKTKSGAKYETFSLGISSAKGNTAWLELFGMESDVIKTMDSDGNKIEISSSDRFDSDVVESVANYKKNVIKINDERKAFISAYDAVQYLVDNVDEIKDKKLTITGTTSLNEYQGTLSQRFQIQNVYLADEDAKCQLKCTDTFYWNKESVDTNDWNEEKKIYFNGYVLAYIPAEKKNMFVSQQIILDASKIDFENEKHVKLLTFKLRSMGLDLVDGKIKNNLKNKYKKLSIEMSYVNGAESIEFTYDMLTDYQKEQVDLGLKTLEQLRPSGEAFGERVTQFKLISFNAKGDYADGAIDADDEDVEDNIYIPQKEESLDDIMNPPAEEKKKESADDLSDDDLFS